MIIAYVGWPPDNDTYMWAAEKNPPPEVVCSKCRVRRDWNAVNPNYRPPRSYYDLSCAYDGDILVSPRLRQFLEERGLTGLRFVEIPSSRRYFVLQCTDILKVVPPPTLHMEEYCDVCKQYRSVWGIKVDKLQYEGPNGLIREPIREGMFFSDLRGGYYPQMGPWLIVGVDTWQSVLAQGFKGVRSIKPLIN